ncbi:DUF4179 domain-containing protein [Sutcliffiella deserti]|uniref:DUF4179 domain-containing protein n=1 Tax=Sutcliffiella deserti TaxID=2875501 RepID=UPI001CBEC589|nr:DUF4179 domain-containing protein [Sutcliffiella deserti]
MNDVEKRLAKEKERMNLTIAPVELEARLRGALDTAVPRKPKHNKAIWKFAAVMLFSLLIVGYHYNGLAYYGKKLLGFDEVMSGTLKNLNEAGMGQLVDEKMRLEGGTELVIDGMMTDDNQLILYYTLNNPDGLGDLSNSHFSPTKITGFLTNSMVQGGTAIINEEGTEVKGTMHFENVSAFSKKLTVHFTQTQSNGHLKAEELTFPYNPNLALQTQFKQSIKKTVDVDKGSITFDSIKATPTLTVIDGSLKVDNFDRVDFALGGIELVANGSPVELRGGGSGSSFSGQKFEINFDALPESLTSLELVVKEFVGYQKLNDEISLSSIEETPIELGGKALWIKDVSNTSQGVEITIATEEDVMLDGVYIGDENNKVEILTTQNQTHDKQADGREWKVRTIVFDTKIDPDYLLIEGMHFMKKYNKKIEIPVGE